MISEATTRGVHRGLCTIAITLVGTCKPTEEILTVVVARGSTEVHLVHAVSMKLVSVSVRAFCSDSSLELSEESMLNKKSD